MNSPTLYDNFFYSSHTVNIENVRLTATLDNGICNSSVKITPYHSHPVFELHAVLNGELFFGFQDGEQITVENDGICLIPPDCYHSIEPKKETERLTMRFSIQRTAEGSEDLHTRFAMLPTPICIENSAPLVSVLKRLSYEVLHPTATSVALCKAYFSELLILLYRRLGDSYHSMPQKELSQSDDENARYNKIELLMMQRMADIYREEDLAEALGLSVRQTSRVMTKIFGMSFRKKLLELRLHFAKGLLITSEDSVEDIAATVGYTSPSGFHIAFKKAFGCTQKEYRARHFSNSFNSRT